MVRSVFSLLALATVAVSIGCSSAAGTSPTSSVTGVVTYKGAPVANASVTFTPASGRPANGVTDASGKYTLSTFGNQDGAVLGMHTVTITSAAESPPMPGTPEAASYVPPATFPAKYGDPTLSGFTVEVKAGANTHNFDMVD